MIDLSNFYREHYTGGSGSLIYAVMANAIGPRADGTWRSGMWIEIVSSVSTTDRFGLGYETFGIRLRPGNHGLKLTSQAVVVATRSMVEKDNHNERKYETAIAVHDCDGILKCLVVMKGENPKLYLEIITKYLNEKNRGQFPTLEDVEGILNNAEMWELINAVLRNIK